MEKDNMRDLCIQQGYVPPNCKLNGILIMGLIQKGECPCDGCNHDRNDCKGKEKVDNSYNDKIYEYQYNKHLYEQRMKDIERKNKHKTGLNILEIDEERTARGTELRLVIKDISDEKSHTLIFNKGYQELNYILPSICVKYKIQQIHVNSLNIYMCMCDIISNLELYNVDIVPFKTVRMKL